MLQKILFFIIFTLLAAFIFSQDTISLRLKKIYASKETTKDYLSFEKWGKEAIRKIKNEFESSDVNLKKIQNGVYKFSANTFVYLDYEELTKNRLRYLAFTDSLTKNFLIIKDQKMCYVANENNDNSDYYRFNLSGIIFDDDDFNNSKYKLDKLFEKINSDFITEAIINRSDINQIYAPYETIWKNYLFEIDDKYLLFKRDVEYSMKNETVILNPFAGNLSIPSKILPIWEKNTAILKSPPKSIFFLNELLTFPNLFYVLEHRRKINLLSSEKLTISSDLQKKIKENESKISLILDNFEKQNIINLAVKTRINYDKKSQNFLDTDYGKIFEINRFLLEEAYAGLCPFYLDLPKFDENITGDYSNYTDDKTKALLVDRNVEGRVYFEKKINSASSDQSEDIYKKNRLSPSFEDSDVVLLSLSVKDFEDFDSDKYFLIKSDSLFEDAYYNISFKDTLPYQYVYDALVEYFENKKSSKVFETLNKKMERLLGVFCQYSKATVEIDYQNYKGDGVRRISEQILRKIYFNLKSSKIKIDKDEENWEIKTGFLKIDEDAYSADFLQFDELSDKK
ncbi:MAG TPA: hypothetical protein PLO89_01195 [Spirochaetota bacterium]|nr:hypothetical protein [Spirochaetota bacterium]